MSVRSLMHLQRYPIFPDEPEHFVGIACHRLEMRARVLELLGMTCIPENDFDLAFLERRLNSKLIEAVSQMLAIPITTVIGTYLIVRRQQRIEVVAKGHVHHWSVVDCSDRHRQEIIGGVRSFFRDALTIELMRSDRSKRI